MIVVLFGGNSSFWEALPEVIENASKGPLGIVALLIISITIIALIFFRKSTENVKTRIFTTLLFGVVVFVLALFWEYHQQQRAEKPPSAPFQPAPESRGHKEAPSQLAPLGSGPGFLQFAGTTINLYRGHFWADATYKNGGGRPVSNALLFAQVSVWDVSKDKHQGDTDTTLVQDFQQRTLKGMAADPVQGSNVSAPGSLWTSVRLPDLSELPNGAEEGLLDGTWRVYFLSMVSWGDESPRKQLWNCTWISGLTYPPKQDEGEIAHNCEIHLKKQKLASTKPPIAPLSPCPRVGIELDLDDSQIKDIHSKGCFETGVSVKGHHDSVEGATAETRQESK